MPKLIPISSKQMKAMGIVQSKNGFLMREKKAEPKKEVKEVKQEKKEAKPRVQQVEVVVKGAKQVENKRLEDRGVY